MSEVYIAFPDVSAHLRSGLAGKVAIVTGAGRGIGRAEAMHLAAAGCRVVVNDLGTAAPDGGGSEASVATDVASEIVARGGVAVANHGDVSDAADVERLIGQALEEFGRLDILINNAGNLPHTRVLPDMELDEIDRTIRVHIRG